MWCWRRLEGPLDSEEIHPMNPKGNQSRIFIGRTETPILWPPDANNWFHWKRPQCWERLKAGGEKDKMVGCHHRLNGHEFEQFLAVGDGQRSLACCSPWGCKESDMTEQLDWYSTPSWRNIKKIVFFPDHYSWSNTSTDNNDCLPSSFFFFFFPIEVHNLLTLVGA